MAANKFTKFLILLGVFSAGLAIPAAAQTFDTSGLDNLSGPYFVRQVTTTDLDPNTRAFGRAVSSTGVMIFNGQVPGQYTFIGQMSDTVAGTSGAVYSTS